MSRDVAGLRLVCAGDGVELLRSALGWAADVGARAELAETVRDPLAYAPPKQVDLLVLGLGEQPEDEAAWWSERLATLERRPPVVLVSTHSSIRLAMHAERLRALAVLTTPLSRDDFLDVLRRAAHRPTGRRIPLPDVPADPVGGHYLVGQSLGIARVRRMIARLAPSDATALIVGESGTGKELVARAIHEFGPRARAPFVAVNCAAVPESLLESELFGHERGAFTGAVARHHGRFERASGGTLFLDEVADMSPALQAKMLRAVQERQIERVGGTTPVPVDVRLVAATNRSLEDAVARGEFREDLYYRLAVVTIRLPSLTEHMEDLLPLIAHFTRRFAALYGKKIDYICSRALQALRAHGWPGNVRELRNVIERAVILADSDTLEYRCFSSEPWSTERAPRRTDDRPGPVSLEELEAQHIARVLRDVDHSVTEAARVLGIHRNSLARKIRRYNLR